MADRIDPVARSRNMSRIRSKDTRPELILRQLLHRRGLRYRLHVANLPGKPDLVFSSRRAVIFVHGCFWHGHEGCPRFHMPRTQVDYWAQKINRNQHNDRRAVQALEDSGWRVLKVWECAISTRRDTERETLIDRIAQWLSDEAQPSAEFQ